MTMRGRVLPDQLTNIPWNRKAFCIQPALPPSLVILLVEIYEPIEQGDLQYPTMRAWVQSALLHDDLSSLSERRPILNPGILVSKQFP